MTCQDQTFEVNRWIVSAYDFTEHKSPEKAEQEREMLARMFPHRRFRIYRIKSIAVPSGSILMTNEGETSDDTNALQSR